MRLLAAMLVAAVPAAAAAQAVCPRSAPEIFPFDRSEGVPINGIVRVLYREAISAPPAGEERTIEVFEVDEDGAVVGRVAGSAVLGTDAMREGSEAVWRSEALLEPETDYTATFHDEIAAEPPSFRFSTGSVVDESAPDFGGAESVRIVESQDPLSEDGYLVELEFPAADDEAGAGNVEYVVYQTDGPDFERPVERTRVRCIQPGGGIAPFVVPRSEIGRWACFQARAVDMFGRSDGNDVEACGIPEGPGVFRSCSAADGRGGASMAALVMGALAASRRRRRFGYRQPHSVSYST